MIIVTGGAGFIGSCLLWRLNKDGISDILVVDRLDASGKWKNLNSKKFRDYIDKEDFLNLILNNKINKKISAIFHIGACTSTTLTDAAYFMRNNYEYSKELCKYALRRDIRFIYASSAATYGDGSLGYSDDDKTTLQLNPLNIYGYSKQLFDIWILNNKLTSKVAGLKYFNVFGPNEYHKGDMRSVIAKSFDKVVKEKKMRLFKSYKKEYKDGEQKRDFIYVKDVVEITYHFLSHKDKNGIYNVGTGTARTWNDLAYSIFSALKMKPDIEYFEMPEILKDKYQYFTQANPDKLRKAGYKNEFTKLEDAVKDYVGFLKESRYL